MRDLEIRGAGDLLGGEQSGHVAALGFELYVELLNEAVAELQGQRRVAARPVRVDARVDAYVPQPYIGSEALKIDLHRRLALSETEDELRELQASLEDRFGPLPEPVENLFAIQEAKLKLAAARRRLPRLPRRQGDGRAARARLTGAAELRSRIHTAVYTTGQQRGLACAVGRIRPSDPAGRCYPGGAPGSVRRKPSAAGPASSRHPRPGIPMRLLRLIPLVALLAVVVVAAGCGGGGAQSVSDRRRRRRRDTNITKAQFALLMDGTKRAYVARKTRVPEGRHGAVQGAAGSDDEVPGPAVASSSRRRRTLGITVTDKDVTGAPRRRSRSSTSAAGQKKYQAQLKAQGLTEELLALNLQGQILSETIFEKVTGDVKVSDDDIKKYYDDAQVDVRSRPQSRDVRHILVKSKALADSSRRSCKAGAELRGAREEVLEGSGLGGAGRQADDLEGPDRAAVRQGRVLAQAERDLRAGPHAVRLAHHPGARAGQAGDACSR